MDSPTKRFPRRTRKKKKKPRYLATLIKFQNLNHSFRRIKIKSVRKKKEDWNKRSFCKREPELTSGCVQTGSAAVALLRGENGPDKAKKRGERTSFVPPQDLKSTFKLILCCIFHRVIKGLQRVGALVLVWRDYFLTTVRWLLPTGTTARMAGRCFLFLCPTPRRYQIRSLRCCRSPVCTVGQQLNRSEPHSWWRVQVPNTLQFRPTVAVEDKATPGETLSPTG